MQLKGISLRPLAEDDLDRVVQIERRSHAKPWTKEQFLAELEKPHSRIWVLTDDETDSEIFGYVVFWVLMEDCQVLNVVVDVEHRGKGYAKFMLVKVLNEAVREKAKRIILDVRKGNFPAIQLYQSMGFLIHRVQKAYYSNGEDAYQMILELEGQRIRF